MPPSAQIHIRPAQSSDKAQVLAFCQHTWDNEADYIPAVWDLWLTDPFGHLLVADCNGQPVGLTRLVQLSGTEGWMEGLRVAPTFRRQGIGHLLTQSALTKSHSLGLKTLGTCVNATNAPMYPFLQRQGFSLLGDYAVYCATSRKNATTALRLLGENDCDRAWAAINHFIVDEQGLLYVGRGATWQTLTPRTLAQRLSQGWVWGCFDEGNLISLFIRSQMDNPDGTLWIGWLGGTVPGLRTALHDMPNLAHQLGFEAVGGFVPQREPLPQLLSTVGYRSSDTSVYQLYTKDL